MIDRIRETLEAWNTHEHFAELCSQVAICINQDCDIEEIRMRLCDFSNLYGLDDVDELVTVCHDLKEIIKEEIKFTHEQP